MNCIKCGMDLPDGALFCCTCGKKQTVKERKHKKRSNNSGSIYKVGGNRKKPYAAKRNGVYLGYAATYAEAQLLLDRTSTATITDKYNYTFAQVYAAWKPVYDRTVAVLLRHGKIVRIGGNRKLWRFFFAGSTDISGSIAYTIIES